MTFAELGMAFWHDLAAPVIAGILASMIVNWLNKRKTRHAGRQAAVMAICARTRPQGETLRPFSFLLRVRHPVAAVQANVRFILVLNNYCI